MPRHTTTTAGTRRDTKTQITIFSPHRGNKPCQIHQPGARAARLVHRGGAGGAAPHRGTKIRRSTGAPPPLPTRPTEKRATHLAAGGFQWHSAPLPACQRGNVPPGWQLRRRSTPWTVSSAPETPAAPRHYSVADREIRPSWSIAVRRKDGRCPRLKNLAPPNRPRRFH